MQKHFFIFKEHLFIFEYKSQLFYGNSFNDTAYKLSLKARVHSDVNLLIYDSYTERVELRV